MTSIICGEKGRMKMKLLAVCGFGCGSSMVLKMSLQKVCAKIGVECDVDISDVASARAAECDAIFTSAELADELTLACKVPIYTVKRYMDLAEIETALVRFMQTGT